MRLDDRLTYEVDDRPPVAVSLGVGLQGVVLGLALTVGAVQASRFGARAMLISGGAPIDEGQDDRAGSIAAQQHQGRQRRERYRCWKQPPAQTPSGDIGFARLRLDPRQHPSR